MPCSRARSMIRCESASSVSGPKFIVPSTSRETCRPLRPRWVYSMASTLCPPRVGGAASLPACPGLRPQPAVPPATSQPLDDPVDAGDQRGHVVGVDRDERPDPDAVVAG